MKKSKFSIEQVMEILEQAKTDIKIVELCSIHGISNATFYAWREDYSDMSLDAAKRMKKIVDENLELKRELKSCKSLIETREEIYSRINAGKYPIKKDRLAVSREIVTELKTEKNFSERKSCEIVDLPRSSRRYKPKPKKGV